MRRLFFTFTRGLPGVGLLILRLVIGIRLAFDGIKELQGGPSIETAALHVLVVGAGILLLVGLWTPVAGTLVALVELWKAFSRYGDPWMHILLAALGAALALIGPGAWSVDARLFGWKRIDIPDRKSWPPNTI
jgi:putative oxidoreductase